MLKSCYYQTLVLVLALNIEAGELAQWESMGLLCEPDVISSVARTHVKVEENLPKAVLDLYKHHTHTHMSADTYHMTVIVSLCRYLL